MPNELIPIGFVLKTFVIGVPYMFCGCVNPGVNGPMPPIVPNGCALNPPPPDHGSSVCGIVPYISCSSSFLIHGLSSSNSMVFHF